MSRFFGEALKSLEPYVPGEQPKEKKYIKLNTNENPYEPGDKVRQALSEEISADLMRYPDPKAGEMIKAISEYYRVLEECIIAGNGSDEILAFAFMALQKKSRKIYYPQISYGFYPVYSQLFRAVGQPIPLKEDFTIDIDDYKNLDGTIVIANPNAPTGIALNIEQIEELLEANKDNPLIIDEAYVDFGAQSAVPLTERYDNLLVVQTFSKSRSLAGIRAGFAIADRQIIDDLNRIKYSFNPYNLDKLAIRAAAAAIRDDDHFRGQTKKIIDTREYFTKRMRGLGFRVLPSKANFVLAESDRISGKEYFDALRDHGILVRHFDKKPVENFVRITIGKREDMEELLRVTEEIL